MRHPTLKMFLACTLFAGLAACAQGGSGGASSPVVPPPAAVPPLAVVDIVTVTMNSVDNVIGATDNDVDQSGTGLTITQVSVGQVLPALAGSTVSTDGQHVLFTPPPGFTGVVLLPYGITDGAGATAASVIAVTVLPAASLPLALPDAATILQSSAPTDIDVLLNDVDPVGGGLTITAASVTASLPFAAQAVSVAGNKVRFTPAAGFAGVVVVTYTARDVNNNPATGILSILVLPLDLDLGPVPLPDASIVSQDSGPTSINVLANDVDPAGGGLTLSAVSVTAALPPGAHAVSVVGNTVRFTPAAGVAGVVVVSYTATDVNGHSASGVLNIVVSPLALDLGPVAIPDAAIVSQDSGATDINVLANDVDPVGGGLTLTAASATASVPSATHSVSVAGNKVRFTPAAGFAGIVVVTYTATDANGTPATGLLNVVVSPLALGAGPIAIPDAAVVAQDSSATDINVVANDVDPAAGGLTVTATSVTASLPSATHTVTVAGNKVRFTPAAGFAGVVVVGYTIKDANNVTSNGIISVLVSPAGLGVGPVAIPDATLVAQDSGATDINVVGNDVDPAAGGLTLTATSVTTSVPSAANTVSVAGNKVRFTPAAGFAGVVIVSYTIRDVNNVSTNGVLNVVVSPLALGIGPLAIPDAAVVAQDSAATDINVAANDVDPAAGGLTVTAASATTSVPSAAHAISIVGNKVRFAPAAGFAGVVVVGYTIKDVNNATSSGVLNIVVSPVALGVGPVAIPDAAVVAQDSGATDITVAGNDVDPAAGGLTVTAASATASVPSAVHSISVVGNKVRFTPAAGFSGVVVVGYTVKDVNNVPANGVLSIVVSPLDLAIGPVPLPDAAVVAQNSGATDVDVLANDVSLVGGLTVTAASVAASVPSAVHTVGITGNKVRFTPAAGFAGVVVVTYTARDANGNTANSVLNIVVSPLSLGIGPVAVPDTAVVAQDSAATDINVIANDVDPAAGGLTVTATSVTTSLPIAANTVSVAGNKVRFTPAAGFVGVVVVSYTIKDANNATSIGVLDITVTPTALTLPPVAVPDVGTAQSSLGAKSFDVLANDIDPAGGGLTLTATSITLAVPPGAGVVAVVANKVRYTPTVLYVGAILISYTAQDVNGNTTIGELSVTVLP